jgi:predicted RNA-binding protein with PUA-like domain
MRHKTQNEFYPPSGFKEQAHKHVVTVRTVLHLPSPVTYEHLQLQQFLVKREILLRVFAYENCIK